MAQDVVFNTNKMAEIEEELWFLNEDGYLNADTDIKTIIYHPTLNVILICTKSGIVRVLDVNSGVVLQSSYLSAINQNEVTCRYIPGQDRVLFCDGQAIGVRSDYNGVLLLDSILQKPVSDPKTEIKLELPLSEAIIFKQSLTLANTTGTEHVLNELIDVISNAQKQTKKGIKAQKWNTVCLQLPLELLQSAALNTVSELLLKNQHIPELSVASAVQERLSELNYEQSNSSTTTTDRRSMASEAKRRETFTNWPHMDYKWALPDQMAQAGFYHQPNASGDDRAMCFTCTVCLVCWERTDEPWSEHERHSPACPFVMGEYTQNVPLSVILATNPAIDATYRGVNVKILSTSNLTNLIATVNNDGLISVFDISGKIKNTHSFYVTQFDSFILEKYTQDFGVPVDDVDDKNLIEKRITAVAIVGKNDQTIRPTIICGLNIRNRQKFEFPIIQTNEIIGKSCLYLVVYDFMYNKDNDQKTEMTTTTTDNHNNSDILEHLSSIYKTLIPGESDEVFLPPSKTTNQPPPSKQHTGPRVLTVDMQQNSNLINQDYTFMNGQLNTILSETFEKTISDHISDLKNCKSWKKLNYSRAIQCVSIPQQYKNRKDLDITKIQTTQDNHHVVVVLKNQLDDISVLLVYKLDFTSKMIKLNEQPIVVRELTNFENPIEIDLLPKIDKFSDFNDDHNTIQGNLIMVCKDGRVRIVQLATMKTICVAKLDNEKFVSAAYCNSLERLCAATEKGSLHFYALNDADNESSEDHDDDDLFGVQIDVIEESQQQSQDLETLRCFHEPPDMISLSDLKLLKSLIEFEPLKTGYCTVVPSCWSEIQQVQRQRQRLKTLDSDQFTKTWRLQTDTTTWDEHLFEITLPTPMALGHVDVHFNLQTTNVPNIEITLLKQNTNSIGGYKKDIKFAVDETITINTLLQQCDNPVISQEYLNAYNADILVGPVNIKTYLDLTEQSGLITLTSPKLFKSRNRTLLLHLRAVSMKDADDNAKKIKRNTTDKTTVKTEFLGCDCIHEISITIYSSKHTEIPHERSHRNLMLESNVFLQSLFLTITNNWNHHDVIIQDCLDLLIWISSIRLVRNRSNNGEIPNQQLDFFYIVESNLPVLLHHCLLLGDRSTSHKCMKFIIACCSGADNMNESVRSHFELSLLKGILSLLNSIDEVKSPGGLQWIFALLTKVTTKNTEYVATKSLLLLKKITEDLNQRINPYHLLLRCRYGLYGVPFELDLFDTEPPTYYKGTSTYLTYANSVTENHTNQTSDFFKNYSFNKEIISGKDVLSTSNGNDVKLKIKRLVPAKILRGLIETVPLHFVCVSASEGTRLERADLSNNNLLINEVPFSVNSTTYQTNGGTNKKDDLNSLKQLVKEEAEDLIKLTKSIDSHFGTSTSASNTVASSSTSKHIYWSDGVIIESLSGTVGSDLLQKLDNLYQNMKTHKDVKNTPSVISLSSANSGLKSYWNTENSTTINQHLLTTPPQQVMVVERMHSGARRFVILDFGQPILLTDLLLPACNDLVSISIDVWLKNEEQDGIRLVVSTDIGARNLILNDLQPPPLCRFIKITTVGRYGMTTARCRIPVGYFYGHLIHLNQDSINELNDNDLDKQLVVLMKLYEDINCRYSLSCSKLKELLKPILVADQKNATHLATFMNIMRDKNQQICDVERVKIFNAYQESINYQRQLNIIRHVMTRLETNLSKPKSDRKSTISTDKLRTISERLLEVLLTIDTNIDIDLETCRRLFQGLCVTQYARLQTLAAIFLEKCCRGKSYWGNFLADTLLEMFKTSNTVKFPQDRVFILLAYLSRRSPERSVIIDAGLRVIAQTLQPLLSQNRSGLLAIIVDLPLLSWLLIYLSLQLDLTKNFLQSGGNRWDWVFGEIMNKNNNDNNLKNNQSRKKSHYKRLSKQQLDNLDAAQKLVQASSTSASGSTSNQAFSTACLNAQLEAAFKTQQLLLKKVKHKFKTWNNENVGVVAPSTSSSTASPTKKSKDVCDDLGSGDKPNDKKLPLHININHCLIVARGLLKLIVSMDHSSSSDMLLLSFKVMSRLVRLAKIQLGQLMDEKQLLDLIGFCLASKIQWAPHALTCFLQDIIESETPNINTTITTTTITATTATTTTTTTPSTSWANNDFLSDVANLCEFTEDDSTLQQQQPTTTNTTNQLPSVYESDDSDLEEIVDFLEKETLPPKKSIKSPNSNPNMCSVAYDSRLDLTVEGFTEIHLRKLLNKNTQLLIQTINTPITNDESLDTLIPWNLEINTQSQPESLLSNNGILTNCFELLFKDFHLKEQTYIEHTLKLWLTLNSPYKDDKFDPSSIPVICLSEDSVKLLITAITWLPSLSLITWTLALQTLTLVCNSQNNRNDSNLWCDSHRMADCIVNHRDFVQIFLRLLSGIGITFSDKILAGPSLCKALNDFLDRLLMRCCIENLRSRNGRQLKVLLLRIIQQLVQPSSGVFALKQGPLDIQCRFLKSILDIDFTNSDITICLNLFESVSVLIQSYFVNVDKVKCINIGEKHTNSSSTFNEIFACVMGPDPIKIDLQVSVEVLYLRLLKFIAKLVQTQFRNNDHSEAMDVESLAQTDESKADQIRNNHHQNNHNNHENFADLILQQQCSSIIRLCNALSSCKSSSLCMLVNLTQQKSITNLREPNNIGDAVFNILALLVKRTTDKTLILPPILQFLSQTPQLSEPLLWFLLQILNTEDAIVNFLNSGGIDIIGRSLVISCNEPITITKIGTISTVIQYFNGIQPQSDANTAIASASTSRKLQQATIENKLSLINFAPYCTINCPSGTAQPAEILIQGNAATHRRARTPQWSYHFYPDEAHTELTLQLPSAVLLREVHLQPHLSALATCPSAVSLELSANGPANLVPVCPPLPTSGMVFIRLHLPVPEVVNCVLIRLYRPKDANNIGLSQIRLIGNLAFNQLNQIDPNNGEDETHCKHSLGWLRLLHHCFILPNDENLVKMLINHASNVPKLLTTLCELLLVPSHVLPIYLPCLHRVLRDLSLFNLDNSVTTIKTLLNSNCSIVEPFINADHSWQDRLLINTNAYQSACELLYEICEYQDDDTPYRVVLILEWLQNICKYALETGDFSNCNHDYISCISSILWTTNQMSINYDLKFMITQQLFDLVYDLKVKVEKNHTALKYSLDSLLCSLCYIKPEFYSILLKLIGVLVPNLSTDHDASISDDRKDTESMTDDNKTNFELQNSEWYEHLIIDDLTKLQLTNEQLETVALVSRSPLVIQQLLDSGLPKLLNSAIYEFCTHDHDDHQSPMAKLENVTAILKFFTDLSDEKQMRDWLGSTDGSSFWLYLLHWLCSKKSTLESEILTQLEEICVKFLTKCCLCHPINQQRLAKVLCEVIALQNNGISGFLRRLTLQLLLENEKIPVSIKADETLYKNIKLTQAFIPIHPAFKQTYNRALLYLNTNTTLEDILEQHIYFNTATTTTSTFKTGQNSDNTNNTKRTLLSKRDIFKGWFSDDSSDLSMMAAGVTAKDKRVKDAKNQLASSSSSTPQSKKKRYTTGTTASGGTTELQNNEIIGGRVIKCPAYSDQALPIHLNLGQLLRLIETKGTTPDWPCIHLIICQDKNGDKVIDYDPNLYEQQPYSSALQVFSSMGGLALLAQHLPTIYPETVRQQHKEKTISEQSDSEWIKVEDCDVIYEDIDDNNANGVSGNSGTTNSPSKSGLISNIPSHSLTAFGLFLRLPGYAEVLLKDMKKALCLLRLVLGVSDDGEGGDIFQSPIADCLPTLPFDILRKLYDCTPLSTDDGRLLRRISISSGVVHLLLTCLSIFTHQTQSTNDNKERNDNANNNNNNNGNTKNKEDRSQLYWAKGTGFGTGSTQQSWNVEQALLKQRSEEEHVTVLLQVLASYINPNGEQENSEDIGEDVLLLPVQFHELLANSSLLPALSSYLRNDSVLDMARHIPLYKAALQLLRALATSPQLVDLLLPQKSRDNEPSISLLLKNMKTCVDTYTTKLKLNTKNATTGNTNNNTFSKFKTKLRDHLEEMEQGEGLANLLPDIQETANLVTRVTQGLFDTTTINDDMSDDNSVLENLVYPSLEDKYLSIMKNLQFGSFEMIAELPEGGVKFVIPHHYENNAKTTNEQSHPARVKRIAQEAVTLSTSLPLSYSSSVFVRYDTSRLDVMKVLITGPSDTPYANGCFEFDVFFPPDYPLSPMLINLETTGHHTIRFNPNLYNDGKVCLSVLNTWHGRPEEKWNAQTSSFLQVLVSIQSLILVPEPYFNEPGYERSRGTPAGTQSSKEYNFNICQATVRWAMLEQIINPCQCFKEVIHTHFYLKRYEILEQVENWLKDFENDVHEKRMSRTNKRSPSSSTASSSTSSSVSSTTNVENFKKIYQQLKEQLMKLPPPDGIVADEDEEESPKTPTNPIVVETLEESSNNQQINEIADVDMEKMVKDSWGVNSSSSSSNT